MRDPSRPEVVASIIKGIKKAQDDYRKSFMSDISSCYAPEYLMIVYIFQSILRLKVNCKCPYGLSLEEPVYDLVRSLKIHPRYPNHARVYGYCDLSLRDVNNDKPRAVIEVKKDPGNYWEDIARLAYLVKNGLEFGVVASCWFEKIKDNNYKEAEDRLQKKTRDILLRIEEDICGLGYRLYIDRELGIMKTLSLDGDKEAWMWCPVCFVIYMC